MRVFLANGGWVKLFDDGQVAGPVATKAEADAITTPNQIINAVADGNFSATARKSSVGRAGTTGCRKSNY